RSIRRQRGLQNGNSGHSAALVLCIKRSQMGQRTLIIGSSGRGLGSFLGGFSGIGGSAFGSRAVGSGFFGASGFGGIRLGFGGGLIRFAAIIRLVKSGALEENRRPRTDNPPQFGFPTFGTLLQRLFYNRLTLI